MGYHTEFTGQFDLDRPLTPEHLAYLVQFSETRHMRWHVFHVATLPDPVREAAGLPIGPDGAYFTGIPDCDYDFRARMYHPALIDYNYHPESVPGLWCDWAPTDDGKAIAWDGAEKFYEYVAWLEFLIEHFLQPWGYLLSGVVSWQGEDPADAGKIEVINNKVLTVEKQ